MDRRQALVLLGKGVCGALAVHSVGGCAGSDETGATTVVSLDEIPDGGRLELLHRGRPVELLRRGAVVEARSLWCTHFGCEVTWDEASREYLCPCHDGRFDARGRPIAGPPTQSLNSIPLEVKGETVVIGSA